MKPLSWAGVLALMLTTAMAGLAAAEDAVETGISAYRAENYEEAIEILTDVRTADPESPLAAFFLGMAHKAAAQFIPAAEHLEAAVTLTPRIQEALPELIDVLLILGGPDRLAAAAHWIEVAETEKIDPARTAFLAGRLHRLRGETDAARDAFQRACALDATQCAAADYQVGLMAMSQRDYADAEARFARVIRRAPESDLAAFARSYRRRIADRRFADRPLRLTFSLTGGWDSNIVLKPTDEVAAQGVTDEAGAVLTSSLLAELSPSTDGPLSVYAAYAVMHTLHQHHSDSHDLIGQSVTIQPGWRPERPGWLSVSLMAQYTHYLRRNPDYAAYMDGLAIGPRLRGVIGGRHLLELFCGYRGLTYFDDPGAPAEDRDADGLTTWLDWTWAVRDDILVTLGYAFTAENADGDHWDNDTHRIGAGARIPVIKAVHLELAAEQSFQNFRHHHETFDKTRWDRTNRLHAGLVWRLSPRTSLSFSHTRTRNNANIGIYDYTRNVTSAGVELSF